MYRKPCAEILQRLREKYPNGTVVELVHMDDPFTKLTPGSRGTVRLVDAMGTLHVEWENGEHLGVLYRVDSVKKVKEVMNYA